MTNTTIDLGELHSDDPPRPGGGWPLWERLRRSGRHRFHLVGGALVVVLLLALTGGAAGPVLTKLRPAFQVADFSSFSFDDEHLYVFTGALRGEPPTLTAYRLPDGEVRWRSPLPVGARGASLRMVGDLVLIMWEGSGGAQISRLDPSTGELLWSLDVLPTQFLDLGDRQLLLAVDLSGLSGGEFSMVDLDTGARMWSIDFGMNFPDAYAASTDHFVTLSLAEGALRVYDLRTGEPTVTGPLPVEEVEAVQVTDSFVVLAHQVEGGPAVSGYDAATLSHQWTAPPVAPGPGFVQLQDCGPYVCLAHHHRLHALDPETGEWQWTFETELPPGDWVALSTFVPTGPPLAGRVLVTQLAADLPVTWLLDAETGTPLLDPGDWLFDLSSVAQGRPVLGYRVTSKPSPIGIGQLSPDQSGFELLGEADPMPQGFCRSWWPYVACGSQLGSSDRALAVWQVRT